MLERGLDDQRYFSFEQKGDGIEEDIGGDLVGLGRKLIVADGKGVDVPLFDLMTMGM